MIEDTLETTEVMSLVRDEETTESSEEILVFTQRAELKPAQYVEQKLLHLLRSSPLLVSRLQSARRTGR